LKERFNMSIKTTLKASVAAAALVAIAAPVISSPAEAGLANGNDNGVVISGAITRSLMYTDNGDSNDWTQVDGGDDNSRLRILVSGKMTESIAVGGIWEANLPTLNDDDSTANNNSTTATEGNTTAGGAKAFALRKVEVTFTHATMGKLSIGSNGTASDNKPSLDSTGSNNSGMTAGGLQMVFDSTALTETANTAGAAFSSYFGGTTARVRYDTPSIAGFKAAVAFGDGNFWDAGLTYGATYGDFQVAAAVQLAHGGGTATSETYGGGIAVKHASGISAGAHMGAEAGGVSATIEGSSWGAEMGYTTTAVSNLGATSFNVVYAESSEATLADYDAELIGIHFQQNLPAGVDLYANYEMTSFDDNNAATSLDDISMFLVGTRLKF
jgi:hypothetical protein